MIYDGIKNEKRNRACLQIYMYTYIHRVYVYSLSSEESASPCHPINYKQILTKGCILCLDLKAYEVQIFMGRSFHSLHEQDKALSDWDLTLAICMHVSVTQQSEGQACRERIFYKSISVNFKSRPNDGRGSCS